MKHLPAYEDGTDRGSETFAYKIQTPGNYQNKAYSESLYGFYYSAIKLLFHSTASTTRCL